MNDGSTRKRHNVHTAFHYLKICIIAGGLLAVSGCKEKVPEQPSLLQCQGMKDLVVVAHPGDDLLFMNPDIQETITGGGCLQVVYLSATDSGSDKAEMELQEKGLQDAYAFMAGSDNLWIQSKVNFGSRTQTRFTLKKNNKISLTHLRILEPPQETGGLPMLSRIESVIGTSAPAYGAGSSGYDRVDIIMTLSAIMRDYQPTTIRHLDDTVITQYELLLADEINSDNPDHVASARLVRDALANMDQNYVEVGYIANSTRNRAPNLAQAEMIEKSEIFQRFAKYNRKYCQSETQCDVFAGPEGAWVRREYYVTRSDEPVTMATNLTGGISFFTVGESSCAINVRQNETEPWLALGGRTAKPVVAYNLTDGRTGVLALDANGRVWRSAQKPDGSWSQWTMFKGDRIQGRPAIAYHKDGTRAIIALGTDGVFKYMAETIPNGSWHPAWVSLPLFPDALPEVILLQDGNGQLTAFATDRSGAIWATHQKATEQDAWASWERLGVSTSGGLAAISNTAGLIELYARNKNNGKMMRIVQGNKNSLLNWQAPVDLGVAYSGNPTITLNDRDEVVVAALEQPKGTVWLIENGTISNLDGRLASPPAMFNLNDTLYMAGRNDSEEQITRVWTRKNGKWRSNKLTSPTASGGSAFEG